MENFYDYQGNNFDEFIWNYRNALQAQRDATNKQLEQQRRNYYTSLMGAANRRGSLYSNLTAREKTKYDTSTYYPAYIKAQSGYATGLDTLRNNAVNLWNQIKSYNEAIKDLS